MKVQFASKGKDIIYCDDEILKIDKKSSQVNYKVSELGKIEVEKNILYLYDMQGKCIENLQVDQKKHISKLDKMKNVINTKGIQVDDALRKNITKKNNIAVILGIITGLVLGSHLSYFFIIEPMIINDTIPYEILEMDIKPQPQLSWCKYWVLTDKNASEEDIEKIGKKIVYNTKKEYKYIEDIWVFLYEDEKDLNAFKVKSIKFSKTKNENSIGKFKGFYYFLELNQ